MFTNYSAVQADPAPLAINDVHDRGYVYVDGVYVGTVDRQQEIYTLPISAKINSSLAIIVESQGRICFGEDINDFKVTKNNFFFPTYSTPTDLYEHFI